MKYNLKYYKQLGKSIFLSFALILSLLASGLSSVYNTQEAANASASNNNLGSVLPAQMTKLKLSLVYTGAEVDTTVNSTQSFAVTDKYFIAVQAHSSKENAGWIVATDYKKPSSKPAWKVKYNVGHGNGATWNSKTNQIVVVHGKTRLFFNANNGKFVKSVTAPNSASGIAYNAESNGYIQTTGAGKTSGQITNSNFKVQKSFDAGHRLVNQDVAYYNGYTYRVGWGGCNYLNSHDRKDDVEFCKKYYGNGSNAIYQFDANGNYTKGFYIPVGYGELESLDFASDGTMYLMFNGKPDGMHYSVYKATNFNGKKDVKINDPKPVAATTTTTPKPTTATTTTTKPATTTTTTTTAKPATTTTTTTAKPATTTTTTTQTKPATTTTNNTNTSKPVANGTNTTTTTSNNNTNTSKPVNNTTSTANNTASNTNTATKPATSTTSVTVSTITSNTATGTTSGTISTTKPVTTTTTNATTTTTTTTKPATTSRVTSIKSTTKPAVTTTTRPVVSSANKSTTTVKSVATTTTPKPVSNNTTTTSASALPEMIVNTSKDDGGDYVAVDSREDAAATETGVANKEAKIANDLSVLSVEGALIDKNALFDGNVVIVAAVIVGVLAIAYFVCVIIRYL